MTAAAHEAEAAAPHRDDAGWVITLDTDGNLTVRYPDGTVQATGPPGRRAA